MTLDECKTGQVVLMQRIAVSPVAPPVSDGYGERIIGRVRGIARVKYLKGKVRVRFRNPFVLNEAQTRGVMMTRAVDPAHLTLLLEPEEEANLPPAGETPAEQGDEEDEVE